MNHAKSARHRPGPRQVWAPLAWGLILGAVLGLGGCGGGADQRDSAGQGPQVDYGNANLFPVPPEIQPNVDFWRHVYGVWSRGQVAFHDDAHMGVIYEVTQLPGPLHEGYTAYQKQFVDQRTAYYRGRTAELEQKVRANQSLSPQDRALLAKFEKAGGASGVYGASERVRAQRGLRERFRRGVEISGRYNQQLRQVMRANGVPEDLAYLPHVESSFQTNARSSVGAAGIWQFMPATGRIYMDVNGAVDERLDPILASNGAARYLAQAHKRLRSWPLAITSYNHGQGGMANAKAQHGSDIGRIVRDYKGPAFKFASRNFYSEFVAAREVASHANRYFPEGVRYEQPWPHDRLVLRSAMPAQSLASQYGVSTGTLASMNLHWRDSASDGRTLLPAGTTVWVPAGSARRVGSPPGSYAGSTLVARNEPRSAPEPALAESDLIEPNPIESDPVERVARPAPEPELAERAPVERAPRAEPALALAERAPLERVARPAPEPEPELAEPAPIERAARPAPEPELAERAPIERVPPPAPVRPRWGGGGIIAAADAAELPEPLPVSRTAQPARPSRPAQSAARLEPKAPKLAQSAPKPEPKAPKLAHAAPKPEPKGGKLAKAAPETKPGKPGARSDKLAKAEPKPGKPAKGAAKPDSRSARAQTKFHVVKPQETLYRVATLNGLSVAELRRLNKMGPKDNSIRPGQKLKVDI